MFFFLLKGFLISFKLRKKRKVSFETFSNILNFEEIFHHQRLDHDLKKIHSTEDPPENTANFRLSTFEVKEASDLTRQKCQEFSLQKCKNPFVHLKAVEIAKIDQKDDHDPSTDSFSVDFCEQQVPCSVPCVDNLNDKTCLTCKQNCYKFCLYNFEFYCTKRVCASALMMHTDEIIKEQEGLSYGKDHSTSDDNRMTAVMSLLGLSNRGTFNEMKQIDASLDNHLETSPNGVMLCKDDFIKHADIENYNNNLINCVENTFTLGNFGFDPVDCPYVGQNPLNNTNEALLRGKLEFEGFKAKMNELSLEKTRK